MHQHSSRDLPKIAIVVLNWNGWHHTAECLRSLRALAYPNFRVIVVDNGSTGDDLAQLRIWAWFVTLLESKENQGFSGGNNLGIRHALQDPEVDYVLTLNNDTVVESDALDEMVTTAQATQVDMVSPTVLVDADRNTIDRLGIVVSGALLGYDMKQQEGREPFCPSGCCALYSRRLLEEIELKGEYFDEDFFAYAEDVDLGIRAVLGGYRAAHAPRAVVYHKGSASTFVESPFALYHRHRNTIWYLAKSVPTSTLLRHGFWILTGQVLAVILNVLRGRGLLILRAKLAGLHGVPRMVRKRRAIQRRREGNTEALEEALDKRPFYLFLPKVVRYLHELIGAH